MILTPDLAVNLVLAPVQYLLHECETKIKMRETGRQRDRETGRQGGREAERQRDRIRKRQSQKESD